jgi:aspartate aminotransferase
MFAPVARPEVQSLRVSQIREVANSGLGREDILAFWFGEGDLPTPAFIREAAVQALAGGRTSTPTTSGGRTCARRSRPT